MNLNPPKQIIDTNVHRKQKERIDVLLLLSEKAIGAFCIVYPFLSIRQILLRRVWFTMKGWNRKERRYGLIFRVEYWARIMTLEDIQCSTLQRGCFVFSCHNGLREKWAGERKGKERWKKVVQTFFGSWSHCFVICKIGGISSIFSFL